jgi:hypothetical protein
MNITNTMCRLRDLTQEQIDSLVDNMPIDNLTSFNKAEKFIGFNTNSYWGTFCGGFLPTIVTYTEMMQLLGKTMEFTKSDLIKLAQTETVIVKYRDKSYRVFINKVFNGAGWALLDEFSDDLKCKNSGRLDVLSVYKASETRCLSTYLRGEHLTIVWERTEQTEAQKEMEELQAQITKLQEQAKVLQSKL